LNFKCVDGDSVAYADEQTYGAITDGYCIPSCGLNIDAVKCTFEARFRDVSLTSSYQAGASYQTIYYIDSTVWNYTTTVHKETTETSTHTATATAQPPKPEIVPTEPSGGTEQPPDTSAELEHSLKVEDYSLCGCQVVPDDQLKSYEEVSPQLGVGVLTVCHSSLASPSTAAASTRTPLATRSAPPASASPSSETTPSPAPA